MTAFLFLLLPVKVSWSYERRQGWTDGDRREPPQLRSLAWSLPSHMRDVGSHCYMLLSSLLIHRGWLYAESTLGETSLLGETKSLSVCTGD